MLEKSNMLSYLKQEDDNIKIGFLHLIQNVNHFVFNIAANFFYFMKKIDF